MERTREQKKLENLEENGVYLSHLPEKKGFSYDSNGKNFDKIVDLGYGKSFHLLTKEYLLQMTSFENIIEFDVFYRAPKKCFNLLRISLHDWRKNETIGDKMYKKNLRLNSIT